MNPARDLAPIKAPFPWFGGKSRAAHLIWERFGRVPNYVEPFAGSLATLLRRPSAPGNEIVNDADCYCDWPVNEADLHARHRWLHGRAEFRERMTHDPDHFDPRIAGYWIWGLSCWIGDNFCRPAKQNSVPMLTATKGCNSTPAPSIKIPCIAKGKKGVARSIPRITGTFGATQEMKSTGVQGVSRQVPHLSGGKGGEADGETSTGQDPNTRENSITNNRDGTWKKRPEFGSGHCTGRGVHRKNLARGSLETSDLKLETDSSFDRPDLTQTENLQAWFAALAARLRFVKVCCGDWARVCTKAATYGQGLTGVLLDPPYDPDAGLDEVYGNLHTHGLSGQVREWAIANGQNPLMRIALCGYEGEHEMPADWECVAWKASGGYAAAAGNHANSKRERIWFSPHCLKSAEPELFKL